MHFGIYSHAGVLSSTVGAEPKIKSRNCKKKPITAFQGPSTIHRLPIPPPSHAKQSPDKPELGLIWALFRDGGGRREGILKFHEHFEACWGLTVYEEDLCVGYMEARIQLYKYRYIYIYRHIYVQGTYLELFGAQAIRWSAF